MTLSEVAAAGNRLDTLYGLRDMLARDLDICESMRDKAALSLRLMDALDQIAALEQAAPDQKGTVLDELAKRRAAPKQAAGKARAAR